MIRPTGFPTLRTPRLDLRAPELRDAAHLFEVFREPEVMRYWSSPPMQSVADGEALVTRNQGYNADGTGYGWVIERREDARVIGTLSLFHFSEQNDRAEIGYALGRAEWGKGYMNEALTALIEFAFGAMDLRRLEADTDPRNAPSIRALERLGFLREGLLRERWIVVGEVCDTAFLGLLRSDWNARKA